MRLIEMQIYNRAPFDNLFLRFDSSNISVLSGINGAGKTTILSYIVDAFYELAKKGYSNEFSATQDKYYRISSALTLLDRSKHSFVYLRFADGAKTVDYIDIRNLGTEDQYSNTIEIEAPISYANIKAKIKSNNVLKYFTIQDQKEIAGLFSSNVLTYFPAYRYEQPAYLNDPYNVSLSFKTDAGFSGYLTNPLEVTSALPDVSNWIMDIVLDSVIYKDDAETTLTQLNEIFSALLKSKIKAPVRLGVGPRNRGGTRIQVINKNNNQQVYPSIFSMSSGEHALLCLFCELTRQADNLEKMYSDVTGIVLVDEIDKHLHIKLQKDVLPSLIKLFPNVQFIVTSHSPFLSLGLADESENFYKIYDLDNNGIMCTPHCNDLFREVYEMMISENEQFASKYNTIVAEVKKSNKPLIITEGATDWKHMKAAYYSLCKDPKYSDWLSKLEFDFLEYEPENSDDDAHIKLKMSESHLRTLCKQHSLIPQPRKIIFIADRDVKEAVKDLEDKSAPFKNWGNNVFSLCLPIPPHRTETPNICIEHYYTDAEIKTPVDLGDGTVRRIFLGNEFDYDGFSLSEENYFCKDKNACGEKSISIIDGSDLKKVIHPKERPAVNYALSKMNFAKKALRQEAPFDSLDFSAFVTLFETIRDILAI